MSIFLPRQRKGKNWQERFLKLEESQDLKYLQSPLSSSKQAFFFIFAA
jgi:hypothetical protein